MASPFKIHISPQNTGLLKVKQTEEAAEKASSLLQQDLEKHHVFFNEDGFHNHIPHHILALYGTGASASSLQKGYDENTSYQRPAQAPHTEVLTSMFQSWEHAKPFLGKEKHYPDFLRFFQEELAKFGAAGSNDESWEEHMLQKYIFSSTSTTPGQGQGEGNVGDDLFLRLFSGLLHPLIQLMYGVEWAQPSIVAEGLAQAAVHGDEIGVYFLEAEKLSRPSISFQPQDDEERETPSIISLLEEASNSEKLKKAAGPQNRIQIRDGILKKDDVREEMVRLAAKVRVKPDEKEIERVTVEMFNACLFVASSAALFKEGEKVPKYDFYMIHNVNSSPIFPTLNNKPWLSPQSKARILEWKIRMDLLQYVARGCPPLSVDKISRYQPKPKPQAEGLGSGLELISRLHELEQDDGHAIKLGRAALICQKEVKKKNPTPELVINTPQLWEKVLHLIVDSVEAPGPTWVRNAGLVGAWEVMSPFFPPLIHSFYSFYFYFFSSYLPRAKVTTYQLPI
ncbi:HypA protein [Rhypophila decipiens]